MNNHSDAENLDEPSGYAGHGFLAMLACCLPMIVILALIALKVI